MNTNGGRSVPLRQVDVVFLELGAHLRLLRLLDLRKVALVSSEHVVEDPILRCIRHAAAEHAAES